MILFETLIANQNKYDIINFKKLEKRLLHLNFGLL